MEVIRERKDLSSRVMWVRLRLWKDKWVFRAQMNHGERKEEEINEFWDDLTEYLEGVVVG